MADAAVEFLLNNLKDLLISHSHLIKDIRSEIERLEQQLRVFRGFLKDSRRKDEATEELVREIRDVVYEVEDVVDVFVTKTMEKRPKTLFVRFWSSAASLPAILKKVEEIASRIKHKIDLASLTVDDRHIYENTKVIREELVGFEEETSAVVADLTQETQELDVVTLVGMPGIGKTTLAWKIFKHEEIMKKFPTRIWVPVSGESNKNVFLTILREFRKTIEDVMDRSDEELQGLVFSHLRSGEYLIVFDDVWSVSEWERFQFALPNHNNQGKVLITTCNEEVGRRASRTREPRKVGFMSESESWELLQLEVFGETNKCPPELQTVGQLISKKCNGLPLAIVAMGGVLLREDLASVDIRARKAAWMRACQAVPKYRDKKFYENLPAHLQVCFLYLAAFPYDFEIPVGRLILMWIAEGFVVEERRGNSLEETAESYLDDLVNRNLLQVGQRRANGRVKTCCIHRMLHDFCKTEAGFQGENLLIEINHGDAGFEPPISQLEECRRFSIHSNILDFISSKPFCPRARSFVSFPEDKIRLPQEASTIVSEAFKLIRVFDVKPIIFPAIDSDMYQLVHLRHLALSTELTILPSRFSQLWKIQTLLVDTRSPTLEIKADLFKFTQLRHFKTNASAYLMKPDKTSESEGKLQSLGMISAESCTEELFDTARDLKKLGIRGQLSSFFEGKIGSINKLAALDHLINLKLLNDVSPHPPSKGRLSGLPEANKFPPRLKSLTLAATFLDWSQMSILGLLKNLEVLKLKHNAFVGETWEAADGGFPNLEALHIEETNLGKWVASAHHFPKLRSLKLRHCEQLQEVPIGITEIPSLQRLDLIMTTLAAASAKRFQEKREKHLKESSQDAKIFELSIYPPISE